jgi:carboxypeptidase Taq
LIAMSDTAYRRLESRFRRLLTLGEATAMLQWDGAALMPPGAAASRGDQLATLKLVCHEILTDPALGDLLDAAAGDNDLGDWQRANLGEMRRLWLHATAVPGDLVEAASLAASRCEQIWRQARPASDFAMVRPALQEVLDRTREIAAAKAARLGRSPYEALMDQYEPDATTASIDRLFDDLAGFLPGLVEKVLARQAAAPPPHEPEGPFAIDRQRAAGIHLMERLGFDFAHGRLDVSLHPFCGGTPDDVRITTRYDESDFRGALMGVLHETGHALYERGLPHDWRRQPVGEARGMAVHESQSLLMEMQACRSPEFTRYLAPLLREIFGADGPAWHADNLYRLNTRVEPGFIRVDADEVTYPAHVILRYRLERALIDGDLALGDLPAAWNDGMQAMLGIVPPDDRRGCLQDIHWYDGAFGYFPTYTLGAMTAAQLFAAARRAVPEIMPGLEVGNFAPLLAWLRTNVHSKGSLLSTADLVEQATGAPLDARIYERHLETRYLGTD